MAESTNAQRDKVGIIGTGLVGRSWAMVFAAYGYRVSLFDVDSERIQDALDDIKIQLTNLTELGHLRGSLTTADQLALITAAGSLVECVDSAVYVQESIPEKLELKLNMYKDLDRIVKPDTILASSTSTIPASTFSSELSHRGQVLVVHPVHPTYYFRLVEVVPSPHTDPAVTERALELLRKVEQTPIWQKKEILGFAVNRINVALLTEGWRLVQEDVVSPDDMDKLITNALGMRYALMGPFEAAHIAANGFTDMIKHYGPYIARTHEACAARVDLGHETETARRIAEAMNAKVPLEEVNDRRQKYNQQLALLCHFKSQLPQ